MIDLSTIHSLELIQNLREPRSKDCLFGLLNQCLTPMGSRMLRSNIIQPSTQVESTLIPRYDALEELIMKEDMFFDIRKGTVHVAGMMAQANSAQLLKSLQTLRSFSQVYASSLTENEKDVDRKSSLLCHRNPRYLHQSSQ